MRTRQRQADRQVDKCGDGKREEKEGERKKDVSDMCVFANCIENNRHTNKKKKK